MLLRAHGVKPRGSLAHVRMSKDKRRKHQQDAVNQEQYSVVSQGKHLQHTTNLTFRVLTGWETRVGQSRRSEDPCCIGVEVMRSQRDQQTRKYARDATPWLFGRAAHRLL